MYGILAKETRMKVMERFVHEISSGKMTEYGAWQSNRDAADARLGFPPVRWYRSIWGAEKHSVCVAEREWESLTVMEATYEAAMANEEWVALGKQSSMYIASLRAELWRVGLS